MNKYEQIDRELIKIMEKPAFGKKLGQRLNYLMRIVRNCKESQNTIQNLLKNNKQYLLHQQCFSNAKLPNINSNLYAKDIQKSVMQIEKCLGCISFVQQQQLLKLANCPISVINTSIYLNKISLSQSIKNKFCGILNMKGGYIFIFQAQQKLSKQKLLLQIDDLKNNGIYPPNSFSAQLNVLPVDNPQKVCYRVILIPKEKHVVYFTRNKVQNNQAYACMLLNLEQFGKENDISQYLDIQLVYKRIHEQMKLRGKNISKIKSRYPIRQKCVQVMWQNKETLGLGRYDILPSKLKIKTDQQLVFNHKNSSLLIFSTKAYMPNIQNFKREMRKRKMHNYNIMVPYESMTSNSPKKILLITHDHSLVQINEVLKDSIPLNSPNNKLLASITLTKYIVIKTIEAFDLKNFLELFAQTFGNQPFNFKVKRKTFDEEQSIYLKLRTYNESIFTFVLLENQRRRCTFIKQKQIMSQYNNLKKSNNDKSQIQQTL